MKTVNIVCVVEYQCQHMGDILQRISHMGILDIRYQNTSYNMMCVYSMWESNQVHHLQGLSPGGSTDGKQDRNQTEQNTGDKIESQNWDTNQREF